MTLVHGEKNMKKLLSVGFSVFLVVGLAFVSPGSALPIDPGDFTDSGDETSNSGVITAVESYLGLELGTDLFSLYKSNVGGPEEGPLWDSYETTFFQDPATDPTEDLDPVGANIEYDGPPDPYVDVSSGAWLIVKDGNHSPGWYLFDLYSLGWDGMDIIELTDFWPGKGAISHVEILGATSPVPEPATLLLLSSGFLGLAGFRRKIFLRK